MFDEPVFLITINRRYRTDMKPRDVYGATKEAWYISWSRTKKARIACAVYYGIIKEVFVIDKWFVAARNERRKEFKGNLAPDDMRMKYIGLSVKKYRKKGNRHPILLVK